jgi:RNA polymerase sigma factor (sigma-70 family)
MSDARTDGELLGAHLRGDEPAFEVLATRHAAMVLGVCRRLLGAGPDAEDATQATFVLLARKARKLTAAREVGAWLHRSAKLVSRTALRARGRRRRHEKEAAVMGDKADSGTDLLWSQHADGLDDALDSLPGTYRQALVLCYFEGLSQREAAERLSVPESTLSSHCTRGLEKLRARLGVSDRRMGAGASAVALGAAIGARAAEPVPDLFISSVVSAAKGAAASAPVLALTEGALKVMFWTKMKTVAASVAAVAILAAGIPFAVSAASGEKGVAGGKTSTVVQPVPVAGLKLTLSLAPVKITCNKACSDKLVRRPGVRKKPTYCSSCKNYCGRGKLCWSCAFDKASCQACAKKLPKGLAEIKEFKAGDRVRLALTFENVSKKKLRICNYMLGPWLTKWKITGPDAGSVKTVRTGMMFCLTAITEKNFPELAPGEKITFAVYLAGNPPAINQGPTKTCLLKAGSYKLVATYTNKKNGYMNHRTRQNVILDNVWKNTVKSPPLTVKITGTFKAMPKGGPRILRAD